jgi:hypothetical protein
MPDNRPAVYVEENNVIYRASAIGGCLKALWAARSGLDRQPLPQVVQQGMDEGTALEPVILNLLYEDHGFTFGYQGQQFQVELNLGAWNGKTLIVRGAFDEIGAPAGQPHRPIDVKALGEDDVRALRIKGITSKPRYAWQQSVYAHGYGAPAVYMPIFHKGTWKIESWSLQPIPPAYTVDQIRDRVLQVEEAFAEGKMPDQCPADYGCAYPFLHDQNISNELEEAPALLARASIKFAKRIDALTIARKIINDKLKGELSSDVKYTIDGYTVSVFGNPNRFNVDLAKRILTEAEIEWETDPEFWIPGEGTQIRFTPPKKEKPA